MVTDRQRLVRLRAEHDQLLARADAILAERVDHSISAEAWELRESILDMQAGVDSHLEKINHRDS